MALVTVIPGFFDNSTDLPDLGINGYEDTFTRADATTLGTTEGFPRRPWTVWVAGSTAVHGVRNNEGYAGRADGSGNCLAVADAGTANGTLEVTIGDAASAAQLGATLRATDASNFLRFVNVQGVDYRLHKIVAGSTTSLGQTTGITPRPGDRLRIVMDGPTYTCFVNDVQVLAATDAHNETATRHGFFNNNTAAANSIRDVKFTP